MHSRSEAMIHRQGYHQAPLQPGEEAWDTYLGSFLTSSNSDLADSGRSALIFSILSKQQIWSWHLRFFTAQWPWHFLHP